jgi:hypothetical protein
MTVRSPIGVMTVVGAGGDAAPVLPTRCQTITIGGGLMLQHQR